MSRLVIPAALTVLCAAAPLTAQPTGGYGTGQSDTRGDTDIARQVAPLLPSIRSALAGNNAEAQRAALAVIESIPSGTLFAADLATPLRAFLAKEIADPDLRALGLRALGKSLPTGKDVTDIIGKAARAESPVVRVAAAEAINNAVQVAAAGRNPESAAMLGEIVQAARPPLEVVLKEGDSKGRRVGLEAIRRAATRFTEVNAPGGGPGEGVRAMTSELAALMPRFAAPDWEDSETSYALRRLFEGLQQVRGWSAGGRLVEAGTRSLIELSLSLAPPIADPDPATRLAAMHTVMALGRLRTILRPTAGPLVPNPAAVAADPRFLGLIEILGERLKDPDQEVRLAAVSGLEALSDQPGAAALLMSAVGDKYVPVRWTVGRSLRPLPGMTRQPHPGEIDTLTRLASDTDLDVRNAALLSLEKHGAAGAAATKAVLRAAREGDVEPRLAAIKTLAALKSDAPSTVPVLLHGLRQDDLRLRRAAASALARFRAEARPALPDLRLALQSPDPELRIAAAEAVLAIEQKPRLSEER